MTSKNIIKREGRDFSRFLAAGAADVCVVLLGKKKTNERETETTCLLSCSCVYKVYLEGAPRVNCELSSPLIVTGVGV